jgi:hypothetical protein
MKTQGQAWFYVAVWGRYLGMVRSVMGSDREGEYDIVGRHVSTFLFQTLAGISHADKAKLVGEPKVSDIMISKISTNDNDILFHDWCR